MNEQTEVTPAAPEEKPVELTPEQRKEMYEKMRAAQRKKTLAHVATLKPAQQLAFKLGLPYEWPKDEKGKFISPRKARKSAMLAQKRNPAQLAQKKKDHARRVGRPK